MIIYHVFTGKSTAELEAIRKAQPQYLLLSYFYVKNKPLQQFVEQLGYRPHILLDSGAFSAHTQGKGIALTDYMQYIKDNEPYISEYMNLDVFQDNEMSFAYFNIMKMKGFKPIAVVQYGTNETEWLEKYIELGESRIALGGTVPITNKSVVANWIRLLTWQYPDIKFHLLGSSSKKITDTCDLFSCDSSTWMMQALNGKPGHIKGKSREAKIQRAIFNLRQEIQYVEQIKGCM